MIKRLLLTLCFLLLLSVPAYADVPERNPANSEIESAYGVSNFYPEQINTPKGIMDINYTTYKAVDAATGETTYTLTDPPKVFSYGEPWGYNSRFGVNRYAGYTVQGHPLTNPEHPFDSWTGGIYEEKPGRIKYPWDNLKVQNFIASELGIPADSIGTTIPTAFQNRSEWRAKFMWGLIFDRYQGKLIIDPDKYSNEPWEEYVLVYHPPTSNSWGWGRMFREENGSILYKTVWIVNEIPSVPDFFPTPEGETEWREEFLECAKTYDGNPGEEITFSVTLTNQGNKGITDFRAVWEGQGDDPIKGWQGTNPPWKVDEPITLAKGESQTFEVTITVPQPGEPNKLFFKANVDEKTPAQELNQENNIMAICIGKEGLDIGVKLVPRQTYWQIPMDTGSVYPVIDVISTVNINNHYMPIVANGYKEVAGIKREEFEMVKVSGQPPFNESIGFTATKPGKYVIRAGIPAEDENGNPILFKVDDTLQLDVNPANNHDEVVIEVGIGPPLQDKTMPDIDTGYVSGDHIRGDLTG